MYETEQLPTRHWGSVRSEMKTDFTMSSSTTAPLQQTNADPAEIRVGDLLPLSDFVAVSLFGYACYGAYVIVAALAGTPSITWGIPAPLIWISAVIAPFILYAPHFDLDILARRGSSVAIGHAGRVLSLVAVIALLFYASDQVGVVPKTWLLMWLAGAITITTLVRLGLARYLQRGRHHQDGASASGFEPASANTGLVGDSLAVRVLVRRPLGGWNIVIKRAFDLVFALLICIAALPLFAVIVLAIRLESPGPILFRQRRHGINNHEFDIFKFRTMRHAPDGGDAPLRQTLRDDDRITRVGRILRRWSLDELPQLLNVLAGSMSLVGPRPHAVNMRTEGLLGEQITDLYPHRHRVKPGITGWAQVNGARGATDTTAQLNHRIDLDLFYIEKSSPQFDVQILLLTTRAVIRSANAY